MNTILRTVLKYVVSLGSAIALLLIFRSIPVSGPDIFDYLTKFNIIAFVLGFVNIVVFFFAMKGWRKSGREIGNIEKGSHAFLIAVAMVALEVGGLGQAGVMLDQQHGPLEISVSDCHVEDAVFMNKIRGYDKELVCTRPDGTETIYMLTEEMADEYKDGAKELTVKYYEMTNRVVEIKR